MNSDEDDDSDYEPSEDENAGNGAYQSSEHPFLIKMPIPYA